ncbi:Allantoicase, partial [Tulasnella sp. 427]
HFGGGPNLLLPGRGKDMGDGWETRRSRLPGHKDYVVIRLGHPGALEEVEIDTAHFKGNFPESCELHATRTGSTIPHDDVTWTPILSRTKLGPHRRHFFQLENVTDKIYSHVRLTIYPDGGIKRIRVIGRRAEPHKESAEVRAHEPTTLPFKVPPHQTIPANGHVNGINGVNGTNGHGPIVKRRPSDLLRIPAVPLTAEAFAKFGHVIQAWADPTAVPKGTRVTSANQGTAHKFHRLAPTTSFYPEGSRSTAISAISVFRSTPVGAKPGEDWEVKLLERHAYTSQAFIPMGTGRIDHLGLDDGLRNAGRAYLVVVALNGGDDSPDLSTLRAFVATTAQGISYSPGVWHHPMISLETPIDFACVETQIGEPNNKMDCEILDLDQLGRDIYKQPNKYLSIDFIPNHYPSTSHPASSPSTPFLLYRNDHELLCTVTMMEARKRAASPDSIGPSSKKRIISASDWSKPISVKVQQNEADDDGESIEGDQLERFRKEAIFRRMKHYSRRSDDGSRKVQTLEKRLRKSEAVVAAVEACWNQLVNHAQSLVPTGLPSLEPSALEIYDMSRSFPPPKDEDELVVSPLLEAQLRKTSQATQALLAAFAQVAANTANPDVQELRTRCTTYRQESAAHKAESAMLRRRVQDLEKDLEEAHEKAAAAENRVERVRSETVVLLEAKLGRSLEMGHDGAKKDTVKKEEPISNGVGPTSTGLNGVKHEHHLDPDEDSWQAIAEKREKAIEDLTAETRKLTEEVTRLRLELQNPSDQTVAETVYFKRLLAKLGDLQAAAGESKEEAAKASKDLEDFKALRLEFEALLESQTQARMDEMKKQIESLQADNTRLRKKRDHYMAEYSTLKAKDMKLAGTVAGMESTLASQKVRISTLENEARRLRAGLAVESADLDYYAFILNNEEENSSYVASLKAKLKTAEDKLTALETTLKDLNGSNPEVAKHLESEAEARQLYANAKEQLEKYERVYGSTSGSTSTNDGGAEPKKLLDLLAEKEEALRSLKALKREEEERIQGQPTAMDDLCRQIEDLIGAKENEAVNVAMLEAKVNKAVVEKSKADNKFFAAMRLKDSIEAERNSLATHRDRQAARIEQMQALEQTLRQQVLTLDKAVAASTQDLMHMRQDMARLEDEMHFVSMTSEGHLRRIAELEKELKERQDLADSRRLQLRKLEEETIKLKKDVTRAEYQAEHLVPRSSSPSELTKTNENLL